MGFFSELFDLAEELGTIIKEGGEELGEILTDGFKEMVIEGNSNYQTSFEKRDSANSIISSADSRLKRISNEVTDYYEETKRIVERHFNDKSEMLNKILPEQKRIINNFVKFNGIKTDYTNSAFQFGSAISTGLIASSIVNPISTTSIIFSTELSFLAKLNPITFGLGIGLMAFSQRQRVEAANGYLEDARTYRSETDVKIAELETIRCKLTLIRNKVQEEKEILDNLIAKLKRIVNSLSTSMSNGSNKNKIETSLQIANLINKSITTHFIDSECNVTSEYNKVINQLKELRSKLSERGL
jgi:hypothetical protein